MKLWFVVLAILLSINTLVLAVEPEVYLNTFFYKNNPVGAVSIVKTGLKVQIFGTSMTYTWDQLNECEKVAQKL